MYLQPPREIERAVHVDEWRKVLASACVVKARAPWVLTREVCPELGSIARGGGRYSGKHREIQNIDVVHAHWDLAVTIDTLKVGAPVWAGKFGLWQWARATCGLDAHAHRTRPERD